MNASVDWAALLEMDDYPFQQEWTGLSVEAQTAVPEPFGTKIRARFRALNTHQDVPPAAPVASANEALLSTLIKSDKGIVRPCEHNAKILLAVAPQFDDLYFDDFLYRPRIGDRDWTDHDDRDTLCWIQSAHLVPGFTLGQVQRAVMALAYARHRDSLAEFILDLPEWDHVPRIARAFSDAWGASEDAMTTAASKNFFVALIARALEPGAQVDNLFAFEGPQGSRKSRALRALGARWHAEITAQVGTPDFMRELRGIWIAELSELDSLRGREATTIKRLLSAPTDRFVEKYQTHAATYPRRAVAVATTNEATYWQDATGARRLIPIRTGEIRVDLIEAARLAWFAEARHLYDHGATWWEFPAATSAAQEDRQVADPWEDSLRHAIAHGRRDGFDAMFWPEGWISSAEIMDKWLRLGPHQQGKASSTRLGHVMRRLGFVPSRYGKARERGWLPDTQAPANGEVSAEVSAGYSE